MFAPSFYQIGLHEVKTRLQLTAAHQSGMAVKKH